VLGVDTLVATDLEIWGKPPNAEAARETLRRLSGRAHLVVSGVALLRAGGDVQSATATTEVTFRALDDARIDGTWGAGSGRDGPAATRSRGSAPHSWNASTATT
jgi:Nucleotide-binding protein implicated in inhibition of septum formation